MTILAAALQLLGAGAATAAAPAAETGAEARPPAAAATPTAAAATPAAAAATIDTFETLAQAAMPVGDIATLLGPLVDRCAEGERELDRARCRTAQAYLRRTLPERAFSVVVDDPTAISVSAYDQTIKGYRLGLAACIACAQPIPIGRAAQPALITLKKPVEGAIPKNKASEKASEKASDKASEKASDKASEKASEKASDKAGDKASDKASDKTGEPLAAAVEIATTTLGFASEAEATRWLRDVRPRLRATFVLKPAPTEWRFRSWRGYALALIAGRIVDPCTGTVVLSSPPSTGAGERVTSAACPQPPRIPAEPIEPTATTAAPPPDEGEEPQLPIELSRGAIAQAMGQIRSPVFACFQRYQVPGTAQLTYEVAGNGLVQAVRLEGGLAGTPTGACVLDAARNAHFPAFDGPIQTFNYPFFLRR